MPEELKETDIDTHQDPEKPILSEEQQLAALYEVLARHSDAFGKCRGKLGGDNPALTHILSKSDSPTAFRTQWMEFASKVTVIGGLLAKFWRDGMEIAYRELLAALMGDHVIIGETVPLEQTTPLTIVMFDPERTLALIPWLQNHHGTSMWHQLTEFDKAVAERIDGVLTDETIRLMELYPTLMHRLAERRMAANPIGQEFCDAQRDAVLNRFAIDDTWIPLTMAHNLGSHLRIPDTTDGMPLAFLHRGTQDEVLRRYERRQHPEIATWQLHVPTFMLPEQMSDLSFGFQSEHHDYTEARRRNYRSFASVGFQHGLGVMASLPKKSPFEGGAIPPYDKWNEFRMHKPTIRHQG